MAKRKASSPIELVNGDDDKHGGSSSRRNSSSNNNESGVSTPKRSLGGGGSSGGPLVGVGTGQSIIPPPFSFGTPFGTSPVKSPPTQFCKLDHSVADKMTKVNEAFLYSLAVTLSEQPDALLLPMVESYVSQVHTILSPHLPNGVIPGIFSNPPPTPSLTMDKDKDKDKEKVNANKITTNNTPSKSGGIESTGFSFTPMFTSKVEPTCSEPSSSVEPTPTPTTTKEEEEAEEPPKNEFKQVTEDNALYDVRCKVFKKMGGAFKETGIGQLFVKKLETGKHQVVVRAENNLGTILLNILLQKDLPLSSKGKDVMTCDPAGGDDGKPMMIIIRVKNEEAATELLNKLKEYKNLTEVPS